MKKSNLKTQILSHLRSKVQKRRKVSKGSVKFSTKELVEATEGWSRSVSRELRALKAAGLINYLVTDRLGGVYALMPLGQAEITKISLLDMLDKAKEQCKPPVGKSDIEQIRQILGRHSNLRKVSN